MQPRALIEPLIEKREQQGLIQGDLAEKLGQYQSFLARLESGQQRIDVIEFLGFAEILGFAAVQAMSELAQAR